MPTPPWVGKCQLARTVPAASWNQNEWLTRPCWRSTTRVWWRTRACCPTARIAANSEALGRNNALPAGNASVVADSAEALAANNTLLEANSRLLKSNATMMQGDHDLLMAIAAKLGVAA